MVWSLTHTDDLARLSGIAKMVSLLAMMAAWQMEDVLRSQLPAGGAMAAYPLVALLWPAYLVVPAVCGL